MSYMNRISEICTCIDLLCKEIKSDSTDSRVNFTYHSHSLEFELKRNTHQTYQKIKSYSDLQALVEQYISICYEDCVNCNHTAFLQLSLVLLKVLNDCLAHHKCESICVKKGNQAPVLSISQQKIVKKCFQFVVALGILPNLLPGIGIPLNKRLQNCRVLECFTSQDTPYQRHMQIVGTLHNFLCFLECEECEALQSYVLTYHATDILAAMLQLCYAPIKKIQDTSISYENCKALDFKYVVTSIADSSTVHNELEIVQLMHSHRTYFTNELSKFLKIISSSVLIWELLIFQGIPLKSEDSVIEIAKTPKWLQKICNQMFTAKLVENDGLLSLVQVMLDKSFDLDILSEKVDNSKLEAVACLIAHNPVQHISLVDYMQELSTQIFRMLHSTDSQINYILKYIASSCIFNFCERDYKSAEKCYLHCILQPLWNCVHNHESSGAVAVNEEMMSACIEDLHQIFVASSSPLSRKYTKILYAFSHVICYLHFFLIKSTSFLKSKVKDLVILIFDNSSKEDVLSLSKLLTFPEKKLSSIHLIQVDFEYGDEGGVVAVQKPPNLFRSESLPYKAILEILNHLKNKDINRAYILYILNEYHSFQLESELHDDDPERIKLGFLFSVLMQELSDWDVDRDEALLSDVPEVISLLMKMLDSIQEMRKSSTLFEEIAKMVVFILYSVLNSGKQPTEKDWNFLENLLPRLEKLRKSNISPELREIIFILIAQVRTHGTAGDLNMDLFKEFESLCSTQESNNVMSSTSASQNTNADNNSSNNQTCLIKELENPATENANASIKNNSVFENALQDTLNSSVPIKGHGLLSLGKLIKNRSSEVTRDKIRILKILQESVNHDDSYVYLPAIRNLSYLADLDPELVLPVVLSSFIEGKEMPEVTLKLGEVLKQICDLLGSFVYKYKDQLLHAYLVGAKHEDALIRSSSLSNLGQVCSYLNFEIHTHLQEIVSCVLSLLSTDEDVEVRRCCAMVLYLLLKGMGENMLEVLGNDIKPIYKQLVSIYRTESDEKLKLHAQLALEEINAIMSNLLQPPANISKEIRILH